MMTTTDMHAAEAAAIASMRALHRERQTHRRALNEAMESAFAAEDANGRWTQRQRDELLEVAVLRNLRGTPVSSRADVIAIAQLGAALPRQTVRSEEQINLQQFSTPIELAALMVWLAQPRIDDVVLEPSAGHGALVALLPSVKHLQLNELDKGRARRLAESFPTAMLRHDDGGMIASTHAKVARPSLVLMNPPFSRSRGRDVDPLAATRHLRAALTRLLPGGRLVAIMPDSFAATGSQGEAFRHAIEGTTVQTAARLGDAYHRHGTSVAVRLIVLDKVSGSGATGTTIARDTLVELANAVDVTPRASAPAPTLTSSERGRTVPGKGPSLFRSVRSTAAEPRLFRAPQRNEVLPVGYDPLPTPAPLGEQVGIYVPYRASRIRFHSAGEHPTPLVESVAMGSIPGPIPSYVPRLPEACVRDRLLSVAQLETPVYAGEAWSDDLEGRFLPEREGCGLTVVAEGHAYRQGYFFGDGTGVGKGRQIAACILDQWLAGHRRSIWVSKNGALLDDARRDWSALGGLALDIQPLTRWKIDERIDASEVVLFVTYPTLRSARGDASRLLQLLAWAGDDFEGVIAFDEAHEMGGVAGGEGAFGTRKGSLQGIAGVRLQNQLPRARVLYASATGASEVNNLAYATRLGLWGPGTAFDDREDFIKQIREGGIAAMELVARDLKATGRYTARALSFAGVEYEVLRHDLTREQIETYDTYADAWAIIHQNMETALKLTDVVDAFENKTLNAMAKGAARSRFESTKQRFFGQLLLSMKLPTVLPAIEHHLAKNQSVVMQLVTTAESILDRRLDELSPEERVDLDIDLSPREYMIDYLERAFPTAQMITFTDDTGEKHSSPMFDEAGRPVHNPEAEQARDRLIEHVCALPPIRPALDAVIDRFGTDAVAEVTGRTRRLVPGRDGQQIESRSPRLAQADATAFMDGRKRILIFSDAGGTGRSYHASLDAQNQQQRVHFLLEPGWRADRAIQGLGRTHRTHQANTPLFRPVTTNCKGELRFTSTIARRLDALGALTRGQRQTGGQNLFDPADNLESEYAKAALTEWFHRLNSSKLQSTTMGEFCKLTGLELLTEDGVMREDLPPIQRWLNRLLALRIATQNAIFDEFLGIVDKRVSAAREAGKLDVGVETILVDRASVIEDKLLRTDPRSGATTHLLTLEIERKRSVLGLDKVLATADEFGIDTFVRNARSGNVALVRNARSWMDDDGSAMARVELQRPARREFMLAREFAESAWESVTRDTFAAGWSTEAEAIAMIADREVIRLATGLLLPIWAALPDDYLEVNRVATPEGESWLGRLVWERDIAKLVTKLGLAGNDDLSPSMITAAVLGGRAIPISRPFPATLRRAKVADQRRIELVGAPAGRLPWLKSLGCWTEIIQWKTRVFLPVDRGADIIEAIVASA